MRKDCVISFIEQPSGSRPMGKNGVPMIGKQILEEPVED
jgi:hypothetical protein